VASSLPKVNIPVTVDSRGVDAGVARIQGKMLALQKKLGKMQPAGALGGGLKAQQATAFLGGVGKLGPAAGLMGGMGAAGAAIAAPLALMNYAREHVEAMAAMTKNASEAFEQFKKTGEQTFAVNSEVLRRMASEERGAQAAVRVPGFMDAMRIGMSGLDQGGPGIMEQLSEFRTKAGAAFGAFLGGKTFREAGLEAELVTTQNEAQAKAIADELRKLEQERMAGQVSTLDALFGNFNLRLEQLGILLGRMGA
jgi:hypothetical protein